MLAIQLTTTQINTKHTVQARVKTFRVTVLGSREESGNNKNGKYRNASIICTTKSATTLHYKAL